MKPKRPKVEPIRDPTLFQLELAQDLASKLKVERPFSLPGILLGTSAFTAAGWEGSFYPAGMKPHDFLSYYATLKATQASANATLTVGTEDACHGGSNDRFRNSIAIFSNSWFIGLSPERSNA